MSVVLLPLGDLIPSSFSSLSSPPPTSHLHLARLKRKRRCTIDIVAIIFYSDTRIRITGQQDTAHISQLSPEPAMNCAKLSPSSSLLPQSPSRSIRRHTQHHD
ncbi:hypothetical protein HO173_004827 [Letharia columbiana]|uniref:Uncharacterized protein n=1 Tax=Letharia columbiana TaxID=112416 RepID=A0A8H6L607_9LECA|nr:uncharacterized protein HO173_004827 [Letharia columbiana]KAF6236949.1 hypothetical protein HO173_004827 [Letharia columbiana]